MQTKKLLWIYVLETIKTFILVFTWIERNLKLFLMALCLYERKQAYLNYGCIKFSKDSLPCVILDTWGLQSSKPKQETSFSCQLKTWGSCLINIFNSLDSFFKKIYLKWWDINCFLFRSSHKTCSTKKVFLQSLQNSQENTCQSVLFNKVATPVLQNTSGRLLLCVVYQIQISLLVKIFQKHHFLV